MLPKKTPKASIEKRRFAYLQVGLVFALAITLAAFQWTAYDVKNDLADVPTEMRWGPEEEIPQTVQERKVVRPDVKPPVAVTMAPVFETFEVVEVLDAALADTFDTYADLFGDGEDPWYQETGCPTCPEEDDDETIFVIVEDMPHLCACAQFSDSSEREDCNLNAMFSHLSSTIKVPSIIRDARGEQTAYVRFVIDTDGSVTGVKVLNVKDIYSSVAAEAMRAVETMPCWKPGLQRRQPVKVQYTIPIKFKGR
jgi:protein TonB